MTMYQMVIASEDPSRYLPGSWEFGASDNPTQIWAAATHIAEKENVVVVRVVRANDGKEIPQP